MKLIEKLGLSSGSGIYTIGGKIASGKTTLLSIIAGEYHLAGLSVLFLTDEDTNKSVLNKIHKTIGVSNISFENSLKVKKFVSFKGHEEDKYDVIIADVYKTSNEFDLLVEIAKQNECILITSARPYILMNKNYDVAYDAIEKRIIEKSDKIITITRLRDNELSTNQKNSLKHKLCFWLKKPNMFIKVIKNTNGKEFSFNANLDFEKVKIK
jgi:predicted hydrocarbon binding protein